MSDVEYAIELIGVSKRYPGTLAVDCVDFAVRAGEVHALMGENGAGKSTMMKMLAGAFDDYTGEIRVRGKRVELRSPANAKALGIQMIHQELSLAPPLSVAENIMAGRLPGRRGWLSRNLMRSMARASLARVGLNLDVDSAVSAIGQHEAQLVEIAKALENKPGILVMDEPTSSLSHTQVQRLMGLIDQLRSQGLAIVYISHHLPEVMRIADRITVMRDGRKVDSRLIGEVTAPMLVEMMVGRKVADSAVKRGKPLGAVRLKVQGASRFGFFHRVSFEIRSGEIVGIGGLAGAGRSEIARSICGIDPLHEGEIMLDGQPVPPGDVREKLRAGMVYLTEDRKTEGLALQQSACDNAVAALNAKQSFLVTRKKVVSIFNRLGSQLQLYPMEPNRSAGQFSGGNQQKVLLAKCLLTDPKVLILDEPTRGVDVGAKQLIHQEIARLADGGMSVLLITSDLPELVALCDRVLILRKGRLRRSMEKSELSEDSILLSANSEN